jgi:hypothetical protein
MASITKERPGSDRRAVVAASHGCPSTAFLRLGALALAIFLAYIAWSLLGFVLYLLLGKDGVLDMPLGWLATLTATDIVAFLVGRDYEAWRRATPSRHNRADVGSRSGRPGRSAARGS